MSFECLWFKFKNIVNEICIGFIPIKVGQNVWDFLTWVVGDRCPFCLGLVHFLTYNDDGRGQDEESLDLWIRGEIQERGVFRGDWRRGRPNSGGVRETFQRTTFPGGELTLGRFRGAFISNNTR